MEIYTITKIKPLMEKEPSEHNNYLLYDSKGDGCIDNDIKYIIREYLSKNKINVLEETIIKKQSEFEFIVNIPSSVGNLKYFIKAKNKASINDVDISLAYSESHQKKLPCLFITRGKLTKKAVDLEKKLTGQITLKQI